MRILYGLDRLPGTLAADDPRLPAVAPGAAPFRLNTEPLPPEAWGDGTPDHTARMTAMRTWLLRGCGDYNETLRRGVGRYLDAVADHVAEHRAEFPRFHGLYQPEDWCWSALRPLPRAWWRQDGIWRRADLAFWNGDEVIAMGARDFAAGGGLPAAFQYFWRGEVLPASPFRRDFPGGVSLRRSSP